MIKMNDSNDEYHFNAYFGTSAIVSGYDSKSGLVNLARVRAYLDGLNEVSNGLQKTFDLGNVQHNVILEQDTSSCKVLPKFSPMPAITKKEQVEQWLAFNVNSPGVEIPEFSPIKAVSAKSQLEAWKLENPSRYYLKESDYNNIIAAFDVLSSNAEASQVVSNALDVETSYYDMETYLKCRPDIVGETDEGELYICNYKTIHDLSKVNSHTFHLSYDLRAVQEINLVEKYERRKVMHYFFLFQEKSAPFSIRCIRISDIDLEIARVEYEKCKNMVLMARENNYWPHPAFKIEDSKVYRSPQMEEF